MATWDKRTPVSVTWVGKFKVTIYDQVAYDESLREYGSDNTERPVKDKINTNEHRFEKKKPAARYNWIVKPEREVAGGSPLLLNDLRL